jgi:hypothetical protein
MSRGAAIAAWATGFGFGLPGAYGAVHFARHHEPWIFVGFPTYGDGPFESWGVDISTGLITGFVAVCAAEVATGVLLWRGRPAGRVLSLALLPPELVFWSGFALPFGFVLGGVRVALTLANGRRKARVV